MNPATKEALCLTETTGAYVCPLHVRSVGCGATLTLGWPRASEAHYRRGPLPAIHVVAI